MKLQDLLKKIPDTEYTFTLEIKGDITKIEYSGEFKGAIPSQKMRSSIKRKESILNASLDSEVNKKLLGLPYDSVLDFHSKMAYLSIVLKECPEWLKDSNFGEGLIGDLNVIDTIYDKIIDSEETWYNLIWGGSEKRD